MNKKVIGVGILICIVSAAIYVNQKIEVIQLISSTNPIATMYLSTGDIVKIELFPKEAPNTVNNFIDLCNGSFYDHTFINRIVPGYFVQGGDPLGDGYGFPGYFIETEARYNGVKNRLSHTKGTVSMARSDDFNTEGSQFFILLDNRQDLNGSYAAFGRVIEGLEYIEMMQMVRVDSHYQPLMPIYIETIEVETFGETYEEPKIIKVD